MDFKQNNEQKRLEKNKILHNTKMPWGINRNKLNTIKKWSSNIVKLKEISFVFPRGAQKWFFKLFLALPILKNYAPTGVKIRFTKP